MSQASIVVANNPGATVRSNLNSALQAITTLQSGTSAPSPTYPDMLWKDTTNNLLKQRDETNTVWNAVGSFDSVNGILVPLTYEANCYLAYTSATVITLSRKNSRYLYINGRMEIIPSAGVTLSNSGLSASTLYYVYAYMNSGVMTLEAVATGYSVDATSGLKLKSTDATRTLVGMVVTNGSSQFQTQGIGVVSYFNPQDVVLSNGTSASTASTTLVELSSAVRLSLCTFAENAVVFGATGLMTSNTLGFEAECEIYLDLATSLTQPSAWIPRSSIGDPASIGLSGATSVAEGSHTLALFGASPSSGGSQSASFTWTAYAKVRA